MRPIETIFTAVDRVAMNGDDEIPLVDGLSLIKPNAELTSGSWSNSVTGMDELEIKQASRFLVYRYEHPAANEFPSVVQKRASEELLSGLMAF